MREGDPASDLLEGLDAAQGAAVTSTAAPLCILAGAGSGKTRVLTRRIGYRCASGSADPRHVLALTFTRKAANELTARLRALGLRERVAAGTFHAVAYAQLRARWAERREQPPTLLERKGRILGRLLPRSETNRATTLLDAAAEIEWAKARAVLPKHYAEAAEAAGRRAPFAYPAMAAIFGRYEEEKGRRKLVDFDDLLALCTRAIVTDADFRAAQRWRFRHLFVDEFQDVNTLQYRLLEAWRGDSVDLCVVGDPHQAIYAWNGADAGYLTRFATFFPGAEVATLANNYRSSPQVIAVANCVLDGSEQAGFRLRATRPTGPVPVVHAYDTDRHETRGIARAVRDRHGPDAPWSHQAVLTRTNAQIVLLEEAFRAVGIPFRTRGRAAFLDLPDVVTAVRGLGAAPSFAEGVARLEAAAEDAAPGDRIPDGADDPDHGAGRGDRNDSPVDAGAGGSGLRPGAGDSALSHRRNLEALLRLADEYLGADPHPTPAGFGAWLAATLRSEEGEVAGDTVEIATFHSAKGLEWPIVHVAGLENGLVPIGHARSGEAEAEERRLLYVALTRAERELRLTWARQRTFGTRASQRSPSPYLGPVQQLLAALAAGAEPADWRPHVQHQREQLQRASRGGRAGTGRQTVTAELVDHADIALFDELKRWRSETARAATVPAYVIFHDSTLREVARLRPRSDRALRAVPGVGPVKATRFGDAVLAVVARHGSARRGPEG